MADPTPALSIEERVALLEGALDPMADLLAASGARSLALMQLLHDRGLLDRGDVAAWIREKRDEADAAVELGPEYAAFCRWRREQEGRDVPPDDQGER